MAQAGLSTLGVLFGYGVETTTGQKPTAFNLLTRISSIGGVSLETEQIDASALEDAITRYVPGRADSGGSFPVTVNLTAETIQEWETVISAYKTAEKDGKRMWFETYSPRLDKAFFVVAVPPMYIPQPETEQNGLWTVEMKLTIEEYVGLDTKIEPTAVA